MGDVVISGKTIICFANGWDFHPTSKHHIMRKLAERNHVIWINWHSSRRPRPVLNDIRSMLSKLWQIRSGPRQVSPGMTVITPPQIPLPGSAWARRLNRRMVRRAISKATAALPRRPVQVWSFAPDVGDLVGCFDAELVLYYCVDAFGEFPGYDRELIERCERSLMAHSDVVIATSPPLLEHCGRLHHEVHFVQHGVAHAHLSRALSHDLQPPRELRDLPRPILGFVGTFGGWVDLQSIADLARRRPQASIILIGPEESSRGPCAGLPNIHWIGARDHRDLPAYLKCFDVGLIPFRQMPLTYAANPIKLYEYLAAGVPAVSSPMPVVKPLPGSVWIAATADDMARCCDEAAQCNSAAERKHRSQLMLAESWDARLEQISGIVDGVLRPSDNIALASPAAAEPELLGCA